jgi:tryptophan-rich sensory protein
MVTLMNDSLITFLICICIPFISSVVGSFFSPGRWYESLVKPWFNPPRWLFAPVWTLLFILMGISLYLIVRSQHTYTYIALICFGIQLTLNALWTPIFFGMQSIIGGFAVIVSLLIALSATIYLFYMIDKRAAFLLVPYFAWSLYATLLNGSLWYLNV